MNLLIAPDSFKGSLTSREAGEAIARGFARVFPDADLTVLPLADGGEGTVDALVAAVGGEILSADAPDPLLRMRKARFALLPDGTATLEMAEASGLALLRDTERDPAVTSTYGTGALLRAALGAGAKRIFLGIGGSATNDGGAGMARALGARFLDKDGRELPEGGLALRDLDKIDVSDLDPRLAHTPVLVACDVTNPLCGPLGASFVYGPQKGADAALCRALDAALSHYGRKLAELLGRDIADLPGAGAAGGLGAGLMAFCGGVLQPGFDEISRLVALEAKIQAADLVVTGEGRIDRTSAMGKVLSGVGASCKKYGRPAVAFGGGIGPGADDVLACGISAYCAIADGPMSAERAIADAAALLEAAAARQARFLKAGTILNDV